MRKIFNYPLGLNGVLELPLGAKILAYEPSSQTGRADCVLEVWAEVDSQEIETVFHEYEIVFTGDPLPEDKLLEYVDTFRVTFLVIHLYKVLPKPVTQ